MNAKICFEATQNADDVKGCCMKNAVEAVSCKEAYEVKSDNGKYNVTVIDCGVKKSFVDELCRRECNVKVVPYNTAADTILNENTDGVMICGGPGNPADNTEIIAEIEKLFGKLPMFGIGLGHHLMALANGAKTYKLKYGHRGSNQPSHKVNSNRTYITSQNCGYAVDIESISVGEITYVNANDNTCEGIEYADKKAFSVQFYPESIDGLHSTSFLYDKFIAMMGGN